MTYQSLAQLNGPSLLNYSGFKNFYVTQWHFIFSFFRHISLPYRPFCSPTFANCIWKDLHALIFDKSLHCAVLFTIFGFCTVCQICQRHCVTCHFWSNILRKWLLAGVSKFVSYLDIAISLWKSDFEWSSSWNECLIKEYRSKKCILSLCDILEVV